MNVAVAKAHLSELIDAALNGEEIVIARRNQPAVKLTAIKSRRRRPRFGTLAGSILYIAPDFDAPLPEFAEYTR